MKELQLIWLEAQLALGVLAAYAGLVAVVSVITLATYAWDKRAARRQAWRTPEATLHLLALAGGWPGALAGQAWLRHKSRKIGFQIVTWLTVPPHVAWTAWLIGSAVFGK